MRGGILDIYPPHAEQPSRIELDDALVASIKRFDPDDQRTLGSAEALSIHPVRDTLLGKDELARARERVSDLCDALNLPTLRRRQLVDDVASGRRFLGVESFLPAFYDKLETLFDYLPDDVRHVVIDPLGVAEALHEELDRARRDREAKVEAKAPVFALDALYMRKRGAATADAGAAGHGRASPGRARRTGGARAGERGDRASSRRSSEHALLRIAAEDQAPLAGELRAHRLQGNTLDPLEPLCRRVNRWLEEGLRVLITARTQVQAERLASLLRGYQLQVQKPQAFSPALLRERPSGRAELVVGPLEDGFVLPSHALAIVTEEEIFGSHKARRAQRKQTRDKNRAFVQDLRELHVGDYVVHIEHGVGVYRGLSLSELPVTRFEALQGKSPSASRCWSSNMRAATSCSCRSRA